MKIDELKNNNDKKSQEQFESMSNSQFILPTDETEKSSSLNETESSYDDYSNKILKKFLEHLGERQQQQQRIWENLKFNVEDKNRIIRKDNNSLARQLNSNNNSTCFIQNKNNDLESDSDSVSQKTLLRLCVAFNSFLAEMPVGQNNLSEKIGIIENEKGFLRILTIEDINSSQEYQQTKYYYTNQNSFRKVFLENLCCSFNDNLIRFKEGKFNLSDRWCFIQGADGILELTNIFQPISMKQPNSNQSNQQIKIVLCKMFNDWLASVPDTSGKLGDRIFIAEDEYGELVVNIKQTTQELNLNNSSNESQSQLSMSMNEI